ncbi:MAG TPA: protein kinase [Gemmatimonadaceae bacterium]|nr:protein kinase [Gemmatimonadaceae bacterium]
MTRALDELATSLAGRYTLQRELGRGGMATVFLAHDVRHDRSVALKVLHPDLANALGPERFQREIKLAARLQHPHILTVYDSGEDAGQLWFTMPFVDGETLRERLTREKQLSIDDAVRIAREAADALDYAHRHGVIHRDIKPENILLSEGHALVADFGIARSPADGDAQLTQTGTSVGTAAYMSPEQAAGERDVDGRSDVYSLAIVLYEMLAGETPFAAATPQATIARRFTETATPLRRIRDSVPEPVELAVQRALSRTTADRFATARQFADALAPTSGTTYRSAVASTSKQRRFSSSLAMLGIGVLIGLGVLFAWRRHEPAVAQANAGVPRLAVLPFENLGDSADAYFADGVTDAVRGKLTALPGLEVIARASSEQYRDRKKSPQQIAEELGVRYLLTGTVRWARAPDGTSRVQVSPELVDMGDGTARNRWQQPFDAPLTDVFEVQGDIAGQVASALDVALASGERQKLAERPTQNLAAYDAYLKGEALTGTDFPSLQRAIAFYEQAVKLDPDFGVAWARLAYRLGMANTRVPTAQRVAAMDSAIARAMTLAPYAAATYWARTVIASLRNDTTGLKAIQKEGVARYPSDPDLLRGVAVTQLTDLSDSARVDSGLATYRRALALDPRSVRTLRGYGNALAAMQRLGEAREQFRRALDISPGDLSSIESLTYTYLTAGDLAGTRQVLDGTARTVDRRVLLAQTAIYQDRYWVLTREQQDTLFTLPVATFDNDPGSRALAFAETYYLRGDTALARSWGDSAQRHFRVAGRANPSNAQYQGLIGIGLAYAGHYREAVREGEKAVAMSEGTPIDGSLGYVINLLARSHVLAGNYDKALDLLEQIYDKTNYTTAGWLRIDPEWAPLHGNPRFEKLIAAN